MSTKFVNARVMCHYQTKYVDCGVATHYLPVDGGQTVCKKHLEDKIYEKHGEDIAKKYLKRYYEELAKAAEESGGDLSSREEDQEEHDKTEVV